MSTRHEEGWFGAMFPQRRGLLLGMVLIGALAVGVNAQSAWSGWMDRVFDGSLAARRDWVAVVGGGERTFARRADGSLVGWGANVLANVRGLCRAPALPANLTYAMVSCGVDHTMALRSDGLVVAWGVSGSGATTVPALPPGLAYVDISAGYYHSVARRSDGSAIAWGWTRH